MKDFVAQLSSASGQSLGLVFAVALTGLAYLLLPKAEAKSAKQPLLFLVGHVLMRGLLGLLQAPSSLHTTVNLVALTLLLLAVGRAAVLLVVEALFGHRLGRPLPKIIRDIIQAVVYFFLLLAFLQQLGVEPGQLLTTSALLTAAVGLALQDTLGNLVAGLSVQVQQPFTVGDWIQFDTDPKNVGRVVEINWRATTLQTLDEFHVVVPNGLLAKAPLRVFTRPTKVVRRNVYVHVSYAIPPKRVHKIVLEALKGAQLVLTSPPPNIVTHNFDESGIEYWIRVYIDDYSKRDIADGVVRDRLWYAFKRHGLSIPFPQRVVHVEQHSDETREREQSAIVQKQREVLAKVDFLSVIQDDLLSELAARANTRLFSTGELVVRQGEESSELFIVTRGEVSVVLAVENAEREVSRLGPGQFFGEMALVTGERRKATVKAATECELLVITRVAFEEVLRKAPEAVEALGHVLARRQVELGHHEAEMSVDDQKLEVERESNVLIRRIKKLFSLG